MLQSTASPGPWATVPDSLKMVKGRLGQFLKALGFLPSKICLFFPELQLGLKINAKHIPEVPEA